MSKPSKPWEDGEDRRTERCQHCHEHVYTSMSVEGEWVHWHGGRWCRDERGYTRSPLTAAQPSYHPDWGVL